MTSETVMTPEELDRCKESALRVLGGVGFKNAEDVRAALAKNNCRKIGG